MTYFFYSSLEIGTVVTVPLKTTLKDAVIIEEVEKPKFETEAVSFVSDKFGEATTHWRKLEDRVNRGVGNPCPLLLIGIPINVVIP